MAIYIPSTYETSTWKGFALETLLPITPHLIGLLPINSQFSSFYLTFLSGLSSAGVHGITSYFYQTGFAVKTLHSDFINTFNIMTDHECFYGYTTIISSILGVSWIASEMITSKATGSTSWLKKLAFPMMIIFFKLLGKVVDCYTHNDYGSQYKLSSQEHSADLLRLTLCNDYTNNQGEYLIKIDFDAFHNISIWE